MFAFFVFVCCVLCVVTCDDLFIDLCVFVCYVHVVVFVYPLVFYVCVCVCLMCL